MGETTEIEEFVVSVTPEDERRIGKLAIEARLAREEVLVWMEENDDPRQENAPMWRVCVEARHAFLDAVNDLLGLENETGHQRKRRRRR